MPKVYNIFTAPKSKTVRSGEEIYKWKYLDAEGKEQEDQKNVKEEINSYLPITDYKAQIKRGEIDENGVIQSRDQDFRTIPNDTVDIYKYLTALSAMDKEQVSNLMEQISKGTKDSVQTKQTGTSPKDDGGEAPGTTVQKQSGDFQSNQDITGGANK